MKLTSERLKEAKKLLEEIEVDFSHKENIIFVDSNGFGRAVEFGTEFEPGLKGHFSVAPIVVAILVSETHTELDEDDDPEDFEEEDLHFEEVSLVEYSAFSEIPDEDGVEYSVGAFVFPPTKDGTDFIRKPVTLNSNEELYQFMERWGMLEP